MIEQRTGSFTGGMMFAGGALVLCGVLVVSLPRKWERGLL